MNWLGSVFLLVMSPKLLAMIGERGARGERGERALERLLGMILVILATQMLLNSVRGFVQSL